MLRNPFNGRHGFSLLDLILMVAAVASMALVAYLMLVRQTRGQSKAGRINCVNNLKQVGLSFRLWAGDHGDKYPMQVSTNLGGTRELVGDGTVFPHFVVMSNELFRPKILACPEDMQRMSASSFASLSDSNISYFIVPEADESFPNMWLSGDRNLTTNAVTLQRGAHWLNTNTLFGWNSGIHRLNGNLVLSDGSVRQLSRNALSNFFRATQQELASTSSNAAFRVLIP